MNDYEVETDEYLKYGITLFQSTLYGADEEAHVRKYCDMTRPYGDVLDVGCGIGTMGAYMMAIHPDTRSVLNVTNCRRQIQEMDRLGRPSMYGSFEDLSGVSNDAFDFIMFNESIGYSTPDVAIPEAAKKLRAGGRIVIKDFSPLKSTKTPVHLNTWGYDVYPLSRFLSAAENCGLVCDWFCRPQCSMDRWHAFCKVSKMGEWHTDIAYDTSAALLVFRKDAP